MRVIACAGVVARNVAGEVLLVERTEDRAWGVPGGRLEPGESWAACAEREFAEETGLATTITGLLASTAIRGRNGTDMPIGDDVHFVGVVFEGVTDGVPSRAADEEILSVRFFAPTQLPDRLFGPDRPVIEDARGTAPRPLLR